VPTTLPVVEELSPIERLLAGQTTILEPSLRQFGYSLFTQLPTSFAPVTDVPVGPDYVIGPGDILNIILWGVVQEAYQVEVDRNGTIVLPRLGVVQVSGLALEQLETFLRRRFAEFYPDFRMAVTLARLRTILVYVVGEVKQPGSYTVSSLSTIINALFVSGGPTKNGSLRRIQLVRNGKPAHRLDLYNFLLKGDKSQDKTLQSGDTILVPVIGAVAGMAGSVKRPAIYEIESDTTLRRLLDLAGGLTPLGYLQRVQVERVIAGEKKIVTDLNLSSLEQKPKSPDLWQTRIADGDLVRIFPIVTTLENVVNLEGHVVRPGRYELKPGMRVRDLLPAYTSLLPEPHLDYAEIIRYVPPDLRRTVVSFNVGALLTGDITHNLVLFPQDTVRVFSRLAFVDAFLARVSGLVHRPGLYPLTEGMRVRDLVLRAGDVHKLAYLENAELTRHTISAGEDMVSRVDINLSKALAGDPAHNLVLQDYDHLLIRPIPGIEVQGDIEQEWAIQATTVYPIQEGDITAHAALRRAGIVQELTVALRGEVRFPGIYPIQKGERLSSVLRRAGGYTETSYLRGATLTRVSVQTSQEQRLMELVNAEEQALLAESAAEVSTALSADEAQAQRQALAFRRDLLARLRTVKPDGRVVIQLRSLDQLAGSVHDIELEPGDRLVVPQTPKYINVIGEVYNRTALFFEPGKDVAHYLEKVGGLKPNANEKEIAIVQIDGTVISNTQDKFLVVQADGRSMYLGDFYTIQPQPGDTIVVPRLIETTATLRNIRDIVQIIFQSISTLGVIVALL
jgi:protein involved in polysaccharide export with SLBB domain